jgi:radical SAM-linked protein
MLKINFEFSKKGDLKFISHLDLMRLFVRAMRRAGIPVKITEGFSPHPKFSIKNALKLGLESEKEEASIVIKELMEPELFIEKLNRQLPEGIRVKCANLIQQI